MCSSGNVELVRTLGADHVVDYTTTDFTESERRYDLIIQLAGPQPPSACRRVMTPQGTLLVMSGDAPGRWFGPVGRILKALVQSAFVSQKMTLFTVEPNADDLAFLAQLIEEERVAPVVEMSLPLAEVAKGIEYVEQGHTRGKVAISV